MLKIKNIEGYFEAQEEVNELRNLRDCVEERGGSTTHLEKCIDELVDGMAEFKNENRSLFEEV